MGSLKMYLIFKKINKIKVMKELDYYLYQFSNGIVAPYELKGKTIIGIWKVYQKL